MTDRRGLLRDLPSIDRLLGDVAVRPLLEKYPRPAVLDALRAASDSLRHALLAESGPLPDMPFAAHVVESARALLEDEFRPGLVRVVNATGVVLHTNLGRALLSEDAIREVGRIAGTYTNLELDLETGRRGRRASSLHSLLAQMTGAEAACVVNNNAASVLLILDTFARGREVIVSRSELIEIGGAFRLPDVVSRSGAILHEVGTTNKTYPRDYEAAINERTALLLKSHTSNYRITGFVREVSARELVDVARVHSLPTAMDLGSGVMIDLSAYGLAREPTVRECVEAGLDVVCFSGDKLLGGPQAGVIVGRREAVERCAKNPLMRALRCDKLTLAALEATLAIYRTPDRIPHDVPVLRMLTVPLDALEARARALAERLQGAVGACADVCALEGESLPGGGSLPGEALATWLVSLAPANKSEGAWIECMRRSTPPVIARTEEGRIVMDVRTLLAGDEDAVVAACLEAAR